MASTVLEQRLCHWKAAVVSSLLFLLGCCMLFASTRSSSGGGGSGLARKGLGGNAGVGPEPTGPSLSEKLSQFWRAAEVWAARYHALSAGSSTATLEEQRPSAEVLGAIARQVKHLTTGTFIGETVIVHAAALCAESEQSPQTLLVYSAERDVGQLAYMLGTRLPGTTVLTLHPTASDCGVHSRTLSQMKAPNRLNLNEVIAAGVWGEGYELRRLALEPTVVDVQVAIGTKMSQDILQPEILRRVLSIARWTLISLPLEALGSEDEDPIHRALTLQPSADDPTHIQAQVSVLGLVRVPATQDMQALFLVWAWRVARPVHMSFLHGLQGSDIMPLVEFGVDRNATIATDERPEVAGMTLETLLTLGLPLSERVSLMAAALSDVRPGPGSWIVCCGGIWQWSASNDGLDLLVGSSGIVSYLVCAFMLAPKAIELMLLVCNSCGACDQQLLQEELTPEPCVECASCLAQTVAPKLLGGHSAGAPVMQQSTPAPNTQVQDFVGPLVDDIPGLGDLGNVLVLSAEECAHLCRENPRCLAFEYSPSVKDLYATVRNCQLDSSRTRVGEPFRDFVLYLKRGIPGSVDEKLVVNFDYGQDQYEEDVEAIVDKGMGFGAQSGGPGRYGWLCNKSLVAESQPAVLARKEVSPSMSCPLARALVWQIFVPPGIYEVQLFTDGDLLPSCMVQRTPLRRTDLQISSATPPPGTAGVLPSDWVIEAFRADDVDVSDGVLRITQCHTNFVRFVRLQLRRYWKPCFVPSLAQQHLHPPVASMASDARAGS